MRQKAAAQETLAGLRDNASQGVQRAALRTSTHNQLLEATVATCYELKDALILHDQQFPKATQPGEQPSTTRRPSC